MKAEKGGSRTFAFNTRFDRDAGATYPHFHPVDDTRHDRFGNRFLPSPFNWAYQDRKGQIVPAGLLISPEGAALMRERPGILTAIEKRLAAYPEKLDSKLGSITIEPLGKPGSASFPWSMWIGNRRFVLKTPITAPEKNIPNIQQPYINEMLQIQELAAVIAAEPAMKDAFESRKLSLPKFLFASGQVSCTEFVEGREPFHYPDELTPLTILTQGYIEEQVEENNPLWTNVKADPLPQNFIQTDAGYVWIDPFYYHPPGKW